MFVRSLYAYMHVDTPTHPPVIQNGVRRIPIPEIQAMIASIRTVSGCLVGSRSDRWMWMVGGWIYSKSVRWLVGLLIGQLRLDRWSVVSCQ